jgi:uncharacterized protein YprB with RNaseH-like and TPR domain
MNDLLNKLKSLGLNIESAAKVEKSANTSLPVDKVIQGEWMELNHGRVFVTSKCISYGNLHGRVPLIFPQELSRFSQFLNSKETIQPGGLLFLDTETSSISTGAGSFVFLVGLGWFSHAGFEIRQVFLDHPHNELPFILYFDDLISSFDTFVSYNGKAFDIPMLRSRYILNKLPSSLDQFGHLDLLHTARRIWKLRLDSRKLSDLEREIIAFTREADDIPGWLVPQMYFDYLDSRDASPLKGVFYHNEMDVISLAALFLHLNAMVSDLDTLSSSHSLDIYAIGSVLEKLGYLELSAGYFDLGMQKGIPEEYKPVVLRQYARVLKKLEKWEEAIAFWESAADQGDYEACIELAKYYEHRAMDIPRALEWVARSDSIFSQNGLSSTAIITEIEYRRARLARKLDQQNG